MIDLARIGVKGRCTENLKNVIGSLKIFNPASKDQEVAGNICPMTTVEVKPGKKWETLPVVIDSGATVPVFNPKIATAYQLMENDASRQGHEYELASGDSIPCLGEKRIAVLTKEGTLRGYSSNCADVSKSLQSVRALNASGHATCFGLGPEGKDHVIINRLTGEINFLEDDGINYIQQLLIVPPDEVQSVQEAINSLNVSGAGNGQSFHRQGS